MKDYQRIVGALQEALLQRFGDEVDLIFQYGSHLRVVERVHIDGYRSRRGERK